jgi:hypothetical protein
MIPPEDPGAQSDDEAAWELLARARTELAADALRDRARRFDLARAEQSLAEVLLHAWRRHASVQLASTAGLVLDAPLAYVGEDFCLQRATAPERRRVVPLGQVAWLVAPSVDEHRPATTGAGAPLVDYLELAAQEHPIVIAAVVGGTDQGVRGRLDWVNQSLLVVADQAMRSGPARYVPLSALAELTLLASAS